MAIVFFICQKSVKVEVKKDVRTGFPQYTIYEINFIENKKIYWRFCMQFINKR